MIGTIYERVIAVCFALLEQENMSVDMLAIAGHPNAIRHFATAFDRERSTTEIEFTTNGGINWKGITIHQHRHINDEDAIFISIERNRVVRVPLEGFPAIDRDCFAHWRPTVEKALDLITPKAS